MVLRNLLFIFTVVAGSVFLNHLASAQSASGLISHRAIYNVSMGSGPSTGLISNVDGVMAVSMEKTCDGWIYSQDLKTVITPSEGSPIQQQALFTSWESHNGLEYQFASKSMSNGVYEELRGTASLNQDGSGGWAQYSVPEAVRIDLPQGTLFPVAHTIWLLEKARSGSRYVSRIVFTGTEEYQPELVNAFIGDITKAGNASSGSSSQSIEALKDIDGWPLSMAFFPISSNSEIPSFEMHVMQLDNGISTDMTMNFDDFATDINVRKLEFIDDPEC